jgi:RNA polymerase sigma-70 factor (ECF subfamily)
MKPNANPAFPATRWTRVAASQRDDDPEARAALSDLCGLYWYPVYAFIRGQGRSHQDAEDLTQSFFLRIIEKRVFDAADQARGKFRSFLLASLQHFLHNAHRHDMAECRAPQRAIAFDAMVADERYLAEPRDERSPDSRPSRTCQVCAG